MASGVPAKNVLLAFMILVVRNAGGRHEDEARPDDEPEFADEAGPKETEFKNEKDAKRLTAGGFDLIP